MGSEEDGGKDIKRTYVVKNWSKGLIRAWHGHKKAWTGIHVIKGAAKIAGKNMENGAQVITTVLSDRKPGIFWIPPGWYNGAMSLEDDTRLLVYSTLSFDEVQSDDFRRKLTDMDKHNVFKVVDR
jgi:dTDP-4-dehydrorhamnose 3,5-epimerase-like enzyme